MPFEIIKERLQELGIENVDEFFWVNIQANLNFLSEIKEWLEICQKPFKFNHKKEDLEFLQIAANYLPEQTNEEDSWKIWLSKIKENSPRKGKELFMPIRLALSGKEHGPELKDLLKLIPREEILNRLG
jgi:glutamyl-tRNA synthetase